MKQTILFSAGYMSVPAIVYLTETKLPRATVAIYVEGTNLYKFFCYLNAQFWDSQAEIVYCPPDNRANRGTIGKIHSIIGRLRAVYTLFFKGKSSCELMIFARNYITDTLYYLNRLRPNNEIVLMDILDEGGNGCQVPFLELPLRQKLYWLFYRAVYGAGIELNNLAGTFIPHLNASFIAQHVNLVEYPKDQAIAVFARYQKEFAVDCDMIFFDQNIDTYLTAEKEDFYRELNSLLATVFNGRFAVKAHPEAAGGTIRTSGAGNKLPQFIPGEFFLNSQCEYFITYFSATLSSFPATAQGKRIFLLDMMPFAKEESRREIKQILLKSTGGGPIYFPKNFAELAGILKGGELCTEQSPD